MNTRKILALLLASLMVFALFAACGGKDDPADPGKITTEHDTRRYATTRPMEVCIWWDPKNIYDSNRFEFIDSETHPERGQMRLDNMRAIEEKYNITLKFIDMTFTGAQESISTSIMAGAPDVDVYNMDLNFGIPYVLGGYCLPIDEYALDKSGDVYNAQTVFTPVNVCNLPKDYLLRVSPPMQPNSIYMLGYNKDILDEANQPDPQDLWDEGKWTWDAWLDIMKATTDSGKATFGWGGDHVRLLDNLLISNGTGIAISDVEGLTASSTLEVLDFIYKMYNEWNIAIQWDPDLYWENNYWQNGNRAFFTWCPWLAQNNGITRGYATATNDDCPYVIRVVPWPVGPSGNRETNNGANLMGNVFMIPKYTKDPDIVYDVFYDYHNWYKNDVSVRDTDIWEEDLYGDDVRGFEYTLYVGSKPQLDMWDFLAITNGDGKRFDVGNLLAGAETASQLAAQWSLVAQDYIDVAYGKK